MTELRIVFEECKMKVVNLIRERLGVHLTLMFVAAAVLPAVIVGVLSFQRASDSLEDLAVSQVQQEATLTTQDLTTFLGNSRATYWR